MTIKIRDKIQSIKVKDLKKYEKNNKTHPQNQIDVLIKNIQAFGFTTPLLVDSKNDGEIIAGHGRAIAAEQLGLEEVPFIDISDLSVEEKKALRIADNKIGELGEWDLDNLRLELGELNRDGLLDLTGFELSDLNVFGGSKATLDEMEEDDFEEPEEIKTNLKEGDLIELGSHRLLCGDATNPKNVKLLLNGKKAKLMITDPPYGVEYDASWREEARKESKTKNLGKVANDDKFDWREVYSLFNADIAYVWHAGKFSAEVAESLQSCDYEIISQIIWSNSNFAISRGDYHWMHEPCWYAVKKGQNHNWQGSRKETTIWSINANDATNPEREETWGHSTQKPLECMAKPIINNTTQSNLVVDPFLGSGTTLIAAEKLKRKCYGMELEPKYCEIICLRWEKLTGKQRVVNGKKIDNPAPELDVLEELEALA